MKKPRSREAFAVETVENDIGELEYEVEVLFGKFKGRKHRVDCMECAHDLMNLVLQAEGIESDMLMSARMREPGETVH